MPQACTVCSHEHRPAIDAALLGGVSFRDAAGRFDLSKTALFRHKKECLLPHLEAAGVAVPERRDGLGDRQAASAALEVARAQNGQVATKLSAELDRIGKTIDRTERMVAKCERAIETEDLDLPRWATTMQVLVQAQAEMRALLELHARLTGELQTGTTVNVLVAGGQLRPEVAELIRVVRDAVAPFLGASEAVSAAVRQWAGG